MGVPSNIIVPFVGVEFDPTKAIQGPRALPFKALLLGQKASAGEASVGTMDTNRAYQVFSADEVASLAGAGSHLHMLAVRWFSRNTFTNVYVMAVPEHGSATKTAVSVTFTGTSTKAGTLNLYIDQEKISIPVASGVAAASIPALFVAEIAKYAGRISFKAEDATGGVLLLTSLSAGTVTIGHDIRTAYADSDVVPAGLTVGTSSSNGTGDADVTNAITAMGEDWYNVIVNPFVDTTNLDKIETEMASRFGVLRQIDGVVFCGYKDTAANTITFAGNASRNSPHIVLVDTYRYPQKAEFVACLVAAEVAKSIENDPGQPLHRITIDNLWAPISSQRHSIETLNTLTASGVFTLDPYAFGGPQTFGTVTMYLKNTSGVPDVSYQYVNTLFILMYLRYDFVSRIKSGYGRARLASSAEKVRSGVQIITPALGKAIAISIAREWEQLGYIEDVASFEKSIVCQRSQVNKNRLEWKLPPDLINQFIVGSGDMSFII